MTLTFIDNNTDIDALLAPYAAKEVVFNELPEVKISKPAAKLIAEIEARGYTVEIKHKNGSRNSYSGNLGAVQRVIVAKPQSDDYMPTSISTTASTTSMVAHLKLFLDGCENFSPLRTIVKKEVKVKAPIDETPMTADDIWAMFGG